VTLIGKIDEYVSQLENAVNQLRQENQQLKQALQEKSKGSLPDEQLDGFEE
jgi:cell shape-determining protein MreC|tara:strand:+ start:239 stop:391 length:153 start_codon:yes stop_codon:yes gene_type:complete